jgi:glucose/arabinose dehydrogenase
MIRRAWMGGGAPAAAWRWPRWLVLVLLLVGPGLLPGGVRAAEPIMVGRPEPAPQILLPPGFAATRLILLPEFKQPTSIAYGPDGALYISVLAGEIYRLDDEGRLTLFAGPLIQPIGLAWRGNELYVSTLTRRGERPVPANSQCPRDDRDPVNRPEDQRGQILVLSDTNGDQVADSTRVLLNDLPVGLGARHVVNGIAFGLDDKLYITNGSCENRRVTTDDERRGTIQRYNPDGTIPADNPRPTSPVIATALRNPYDVAIHPVDGTVFASENGRDDLGDLEPPDEINHIIWAPGQPVQHYGWPDCYGIGRGRNCEGTRAPVVETEPHPSANGLAFYTGTQFGAEYTNNLFAAYYGSGNPARRPWGRKIQRIELTRVGETYEARQSTFAYGLERPLDVLTAKNGGLLIADFGQIGGTGSIYRIDRRPDASPFASVPAPAPVEGQEPPVYIAATGHTVAPDFYTFWQANGGLAMFGYPISQEFMEGLTVVQYFERARFERHIIEFRPEDRVKLGLLGRSLTAGRAGEAAFAPIPAFPDSEERRFFPETGHGLSGGFKRYWDEHGGAAVLGLPISEEFSEVNPDTGRTHTVQYFERARFEYHEDLAGTPHEVLLGRLGAQEAARRYP